MVNTKEFYDYLLYKGIDLFAGVPDSLLKNICACIKQNCHENKNIITANEGNAVAIACGYHISTGKYGMVYMQNSGQGNAVNPLLSLADEDVYKIPVLLMIGWRGEPDTKDEPQHKKQGKVTLSLLETMGIKYTVLDDDYKRHIDYCFDYMNNYSKPIALIVKKGIFSEYRAEKMNDKYTITREDALKTVIDILEDDDFIVSTTGKTSREIYEIREAINQGHSNDFLTVGSMGHTASIALGISLGTEKNIYCIDGDGSFLMHMGSLGIAAKYASGNFKYILINNGAHESVGGQPTIAFDIDIENILKSLGFKNVYKAVNIEEIKSSMKYLQNENLSAIIIYTRQGSRDNLGRPSTTPQENKIAMMEKLLNKK